MKSTASKRPGLWRVFRIPLLLAVVSSVGLIAALLSDGLVDALWALLVAVPLVVVIAAWSRASAR